MSGDSMTDCDYENILGSIESLTGTQELGNP